MRILLSNDDGIFAPGLAALYGAVCDMGDATVVAPSSPQSAAGHSITLREPLVVHRVRINDSPNPFWGNSVDGRPADCVRLAARKLLTELPDVVLSGINAGTNVGVNVFYSGTVAAAAEAAMLGIPAVAFSAGYAGGVDEIEFPAVAGLCRLVLDRLLQRGLAEGDLINVNVPPLKPGWPKGVRVVAQSTSELEDEYHETVDPQGRHAYRLGETYGFVRRHEDTDVVCLHEGYVTVTPLQIDMTRHAYLEELAREDWPELPEAAGD